MDKKGKFEISKELEQFYCSVLLDEVKEKVRKLKAYGVEEAEIMAAMNEEDRARALELRAELEEFRERFYAQFKKADPEAPFEKKLQPNASVLRRKQYSKIDTFIQAILRERIKREQN